MALDPIRLPQRAQERRPRSLQSLVGQIVFIACHCLLIYVLDYSVEAPPSLLPAKKYCDITGLAAPYTDPKSRLRYHSAEIYELVRSFVRQTQSKPQQASDNQCAATFHGRSVSFRARLWNYDSLAT